MMAKKADCNKESNDNSVAVEDDDRGIIDSMLVTCYLLLCDDHIFNLLSLLSVLPVQ